MKHARTSRLPRPAQPADAARRRLLHAAARLAAAAATAPVGLHAAAQAVDAAAVLRLGLAPYLPPAALMAAFRPWREHLERTLAQPVEIYTAKDFRTQFQTMVSGGYEMAMVPAHLGALAVVDLGWQPCVRTLDRSALWLVVRNGGPVAGPADLRGRVVGMLEPLSLGATIGLQWLRQQRLEGAGGARAQHYASVSSALIALQRDEIGAALVAEGHFGGLPAEVRRDLRQLLTITEMPGPWVVTGPDVPAARAARWRDALLAYVPDPQKPPTASNVRLSPLLPAHLTPLAGHAEVARQLLAQPR